MSDKIKTPSPAATGLRDVVPIQRSLEGQKNDSTPRASAQVQLPRTPKNMNFGWFLRAELQKLAASRQERGEPIDWQRWCYVAAATIDAIRPGRDRVVMMASGRPYAGRYFRTWAECLPQNLLCEGKNRLALTLDEVPDDILRAAEAACRAVAKRRHRGFLKGATIGRMLGVTASERERLRLRIIGAADAEKSTKEAAMERKRERDRLRDERKRREAGVKPRGETLADQARKLGISRDALIKRRQRERKNVHTYSLLHDAPHVHTYSPLHEVIKSVENQCGSAAEMTHVHTSSPHKYVVSSCAAPTEPSEEPQERTPDEISPPNDAPSGARPSPPNPHRRTPSAIIPPPNPPTFDGLDPQTFYLVALSAHETATQVILRADNDTPEALAAALVNTLSTDDRDFILKLESSGLDTSDAWYARGARDRRTCQLVSPDRADAR